MTIRPAALGDLDAIMALERASFVADAWSESMMREELSSPHTSYVVLVQAGRICGYAGLRAPKGASDADIQTIALADTARGRGQGRMLLTTLLAEAAERGVREVFLDVRDDNAVAQRLYTSEGFIAIGRRPNYYAAEGVDAIVMQLDMRGWTHRRAVLRSAEDDVAAEDAPDRTGPPLVAAPPLRGGPATDASADVVRPAAEASAPGEPGAGT